MTTVLVQAAELVYVFVLPGTLVLWSLAGDWSRTMRVAIGTTLSVFTVPVLSFALASLLGTHIRPAIPLGVASLGNLLGAALCWIRREGRPRREAGA